MPVRIVTNSTSDIPMEVARELDIIVVPEFVVFGNESYRERVDIGEDEFYEKLVNGSIQPTTSCPTPQSFLSVYDELGDSADGIISIHVSSRLSGTVNAAEQAKKLSCAKCQIEIIDTKTISLALGLAVIAAAKMAKEGKAFSDIVSAVHEMLPRIRILAMFDTLKYLARGGRIGKAKAFVGSMLNVKPLLTIKDGEFVPVLQVNSRNKAKKKLVEFANSHTNVETMCVIYSTEKEEAIEMSKLISNVSPEQILYGRLGPCIGVHAGPGLLAVGAVVKS